MGNQLIGNYTARFDKSGRIKIPAKFLAAIEEEYGKELFVTSLEDDSVQIFPLPVWEEMTGIVNRGAIHLRPSIRSFLRRVNRKGNHCQIDSKGRVLISQSLREVAKLENEIEVLGFNNHLEIWNRQVLDEKLEKRPLTDEDFENIARLVPDGKPE